MSDARRPGLTHDQVERSLTNQAPESDDVVMVFEALREPFKLAAHRLLDLTPPCPEQTIAFRKIEEGLMYAVKAVALNQSAAIAHVESGGSF